MVHGTRDHQEWRLWEKCRYLGLRRYSLHFAHERSKTDLLGIQRAWFLRRPSKQYRVDYSWEFQSAREESIWKYDEARAGETIYYQRDIGSSLGDGIARSPHSQNMFPGSGRSRERELAKNVFQIWVLSVCSEGLNWQKKCTAGERRTRNAAEIAQTTRAKCSL